jgi:hypothetical protein
MGTTKGATRVDETGWRWMRGRENQREREREREEKQERKWAGGGPCFKVTAAKALGPSLNSQFRPISEEVFFHSKSCSRDNIILEATMFYC